MKIGIITTPNEKGQIVIPKKIRDKLYITQNTHLNLVLKDNGIYIYPIEKIIPKTAKGQSYTEILKKTQGTWGKETKDEKTSRIKQRKIELAASARNKKTW